VHRISELRASIAARAGSLVEGLEGGELTAARLQELVRALGQAADRVTEVVGDDASARPTGEAATQAPASAAAASIEEAAPPGLFARTEGDAHEPQADEPIADPLPEGAPIVRRPARASSARYTAVVMAIQGSDREAVAERLARDHGLEDADELLDDVFGRADARA
jgi:hypothetical protein